MNVEMETQAAQFLFWEHLFQVFGIVSLQCDTRDISFRQQPNFKFTMELAEISWRELATPAPGWRRARERAAQP
jgi:hypothetical protein